jgi:hypothetical protein
VNFGSSAPRIGIEAEIEAAAKRVETKHARSMDNQAVAIEVGARHTRACLVPAFGVGRHARFVPQLFESEPRAVPEQKVRRPVVGHV